MFVLGRGTHFPIALEGALKLKEISHSCRRLCSRRTETYGPLALVDNEMPVVILAPQDEMLDKLKSNMEEVQARGGELFVLLMKTVVFMVKIANMSFMFQLSMNG